MKTKYIKIHNPSDADIEYGRQLLAKKRILRMDLRCNMALGEFDKNGYLLILDSEENIQGWAEWEEMMKNENKKS